MDTPAEGEVYFQIPEQNLLTKKTESDAVTTAESSLRADSKRAPSSILGDLIFENDPNKPRYEVYKEAGGSGGLATVFKGHDINLDRDVAVKVLHTFDLENSSKFTRQIELEAKYMARLTHRNIVKILDVVRGEVPSRKGMQTMLIMEWLDPKSFPTLNSLMEESKADKPDLAVRVCKAVCSAVDYMAQNDFYHKDIKPNNILVGGDQVKLGDFGIGSGIVDSDDDESNFYGTPHFTSPEHAEGKKVDVRSEVFCVGLVIYSMFNGSSPFLNKAGSEASLEDIVNKPYPRLSENEEMKRKWNKVILLALDDVLSKALEKNPDDRYQTATEFSNALEEALKPFVKN